MARAGRNLQVHRNRAFNHVWQISPLPLEFEQERNREDIIVPLSGTPTCFLPLVFMLLHRPYIAVGSHRLK